ncbi:MAG: beta-glucosidase, partial [Alistipes sp.]|nr:beta-glucosidase [Alistipes sp.]
MNSLRHLLSAAAIGTLLLSCCGMPSETDRRVERLLGQMTLAEKVGQMAQLTIEPFILADGEGGFTLDTALLREAVVDYGVGSLLNVPLSESQPAEVWGSFIAELQRIATDESRMGIPLIYGVDQVHGGTYSLGSTLFPQQIALAATWNPAHARRMGEITAYEMRACNIPWNFAPILDLGADPRFPRQYEGFGEDPYLGSVLGRELVKGQEGDANDVDHPEHVATCLKHFLGYSVPASGKDRTPANIPWSTLLEYHLPAFRAALDAGARSVMVNSGIIDNCPVHASHRILTGLLRDELGFDGVVVTDYEDLEKLHARDRLAATSKEAIRLGINAGIDMAMIAIDYRGFCRALRAVSYKPLRA